MKPVDGGGIRYRPKEMANEPLEHAFVLSL